MLFAWDITIETTHIEANPKEQILKLTHGVITKVDVKYAAGCHGLVQVRLLHEESVLMPLNKDTWLTGDNETVTSPEYFELTGTPYQLKFVGWGDGCSYDHTVTVRITVLPKEVASMLSLLDIFTKIARRMGLIG